MNIQQPRVAMHKSDWMTLTTENTKSSLRLLQLTLYEREMYLPFFFFWQTSDLLRNDFLK